MITVPVDQIVQLIKDVQQLKQEGADINQTEILSVLFFSEIGSVTDLIQAGGSFTYTFPLTFGNSGVRGIGSSFVLGHSSYGDLGSGTAQAGSQTWLGDSRGALIAGAFSLI